MNKPTFSRKEDIEAVSNYFSIGSVSNAHKLENGLVNESYLLHTNRGNFIAQALNGRLWDERVIEDYCSVQQYLRTNNLFVPVLLATSQGKYGYNLRGTLWRVFEYVPHDPLVTITTSHAAEAGAMLGRFHALMACSKFTPSFTLADFHDTPVIRERLLATAQLSHYKEKATKVRKELSFLEKTLEHHYLPKYTQKIVIHGDPKLNNFLFKDGKASTLLDLDTMMVASPLLDIGDALRSWCRRKPATAEFLPDIFEAAFRGYCSTAPFQYTLQGVKSATGLITLELAARYLTEYFKESYFSHNASKYATPAEQNITRCRRYINYYHNFINYAAPYERDD